MAVSFSLILLLLTLTTTAASAAHHHISANKTHPHSKPTPPAEPQETQLDNIIDALIGAGEFAGWANLLSTTDPSAIPLTATFFIPGNDAVSNLSSSSVSAADGFLIAYHIVPQRLIFADLQKLVSHTRLPTLIPSKYIVVTNSSAANFCVDGSQITHPDMFVDSAFAVHGVSKLLDDSVYGGRAPSPVSATFPKGTTPGSTVNPKSPKGTTSGLPVNATSTEGTTIGLPEKRNPFLPGGGINLRSGGSGLIFSSISCAVLVIFNIICFFFF
ncbi:hypothetical protein CASFOL_039183 [Castilleja foliolosa]|uniref:FAS1 domain-containing protein n=1 Tax=Castilleja foliolosa TaxID=1961234 RepID=A0ABD3BHW9_9LAMI